MASKLWSAGKKLTLWGALVSSLPFLFMLLMVLSVLSIAFAVPLGCAVGSYVCFRKLYGGLCGKRLIAGKKEGVGLNKNEAEAEELEIASNEVECGDESEESAERADDPEGPFRAQSEEVQSKSREGLDINDSHGEPEIYEEEKPSSPFQEQNHHVKPLEEEPPKLFYEGQTQSKGDPHAFPSAVGGGQTPEGANHSRYKDEMEFSEGEARLTWGPDANIVGEEQIPEDETRSWLKDEAKASEGEPQLTLDPKAIPMEKTVAEEQTPKDEIQFSLKEKVKSSEPDTQLTSANHHAIAVDEVSFIDIACKIKEEETERSNELQEIPTRRPPREQGAELDSEKLSPIDTKHQIRDLEEEESNEMQEIPSERPHHEQSAELDFEKLSLSYTTNKRREEDEEEDEKGEESNETQGIPSERSSHEQGAELDLEKLSPTETKHKIAEEGEKEEQDAELEENEEGEESNEMQGIPSKRSSHEQGAELDLEMFPPTDTNHKITDEEEEQKSTETGAVPSERSQYEQDAELELAPSTPYTDNTIRDGNTATPETTYYSAAQSVQSESPHKASFVGFEYDTVSRDNDAKEIESATSLEVQVSSGSESDQNSKSTSESTPERDSDDDDDDDDDDDKNIWEEIHAVRKIVGYKKDPDASYAEEIKALYVFTGVEPPASLKYSFDLIKAKEKLKFLKIVVGVK